MSKKKVRYTSIKLHGKATLKKKNVTKRNGKMQLIQFLDDQSPNFVVNLSAAFKNNVAMAREANSGISQATVRKLLEETKLLQNHIYLIDFGKPLKKRNKQTKGR